jgi:hypothetical protein
VNPVLPPEANTLIETSRISGTRVVLLPRRFGSLVVPVPTAFANVTVISFICVYSPAASAFAAHARCSSHH